jgi:hypothetical protein
MCELASKQEQRGQADREQIIEHPIPDYPHHFPAALFPQGMHDDDRNAGEETGQEDQKQHELIPKEGSVCVVVYKFGRGEGEGSEGDHVLREGEEGEFEPGEEALEDWRVLDVQIESYCHQLEVVEDLHEPACFVHDVDHRQDEHPCERSHRDVRYHACALVAAVILIRRQLFLEPIRGNPLSRRL